MFVFWHTTTSLKQNDRVVWWQLIWTINRSGKSQNYHVHFEVWKYDYNISYKEIFWNETIYNYEYTYALRKQRLWYTWLEEAAKFISHYEWFRNCAYPDWPNRYSIWYGTRALSPTECITEEVAISRKMSFVENVLEEIYKKHFLKYHNQRIALTSLLYNKGINSSISNIKNLSNESDIYKFVTQDKFILKWTKYERWLKKRMLETADLFLNKM